MNKSFFSRISLCFLLLFSLTPNAFSAGKVYLVIGSDTAIWNSMNTARYNCTYNPALFTDPTRMAYRVMDPAFRAELVDSYGQPMKMTWWMMAGNIFRYSTNTNVPVPNIMTLYLMKKYHGDNVLLNGDELTMHYHTFVWSDYDNDNIYYWNQSQTFLESLDDFKVTLAQFLLEEQTFPVSFRSGWHYMDNDWQHYLDERVLPYSMHNDYPAKRTQDDEPIDNIFDWSLAPAEFVPYRPAPENYQIPGNGKGWQVRSVSFQRTKVTTLMEDVFAAAQSGTDQVACFWAHLPEEDFGDNMIIMDSLAHAAAEKYPQVQFKYCTAIEAMQLWRNTQDQQAPVINLTDDIIADDVYFNIETDEDIFQDQPFVAVKNIYEEYLVLECASTGLNQWRTTTAVPLSKLAKAGVTVCDTLGNQTMDFISYLPDDMFIDDLDSTYNELSGTWNSSSSAAWGTDSRICSLGENDSAAVSWDFTLQQPGYYNLFIQFPDIPNRAEQMNFLISQNQVIIDTISINKLLPAKSWIYLTTIQTSGENDMQVKLMASAKNQSGKILAADVLKISALVRERDIDVQPNVINFGDVSVEDTITSFLDISNLGIEDLSISQLLSKGNTVYTDRTFPFVVPAMSSVSVPLYFLAHETGQKIDTLEVHSDDPLDPLIRIQLSANVQKYFKTIDNEDFDQYEELTIWHTSNANIWGPSSRYAFLNESPLASARFYTRLPRGGIYNIEEIVPKTVNSTDDALYEIYIGEVLKSTFHINQNEGSGNWVVIGSVYLPADSDIELWVKDTGNSTVGDVIRTDAIRFSLVDETTSLKEISADNPLKTFQLGQNYPNPFNPQTTISYQLPVACHVLLDVFNAMGQKIKTLVDGKQNSGYYNAVFDASGLASGIYYYRITAGSFTMARKMIVLK